MDATLIRAIAFFPFASAYLALLPLVARTMPDLPWLTCGGTADQEASLLRTVAELFERGADIDWPRLFAGRPLGRMLGRE